VEDELADGEVEKVNFETIRAEIPGESDDVVLLAAPYDSAPFENITHVGANNGASGAAALLEMARMLSLDPIPYTVWLAFLDGDAIRGEDAGPDRELVGSKVLVKELYDSGALSRIRLVLYFNRVADRDLALARDLRSDRMVRRSFQRAARRLGYGSAVPLDRPFSRPLGGHSVFLSVGFRHVMIVADDRFGGDEAPGIYWHTEEDTLERCDPESLAIVVAVTDAAIRDMAALLRKVDRYSERPVPAPPPEPAETSDAGEAAATSEHTEAAAAPEPTATSEPTRAVETPEPPGGELSQ
jgi:Zn-dependent M28 family amino/carboxypeptidase